MNSLHNSPQLRYIKKLQARNRWKEIPYNKTPELQLREDAENIQYSINGILIGKKAIENEQT